MAANKSKKENKPKKASKPNWRHYNFTTAGPVDDYLYSMLPKRSDVLVEMEDFMPASTISPLWGRRWRACCNNWP